MHKSCFALGVLLLLVPTWAIAAPMPVAVAATLERPVCQEGQPVVLALALHNTGTENFIIGGSAFEESSFHITVTDGAGRPVPRTALGERVLTPPMIVFANSTVVLNPGQTLRYRFNLARLFDLSRTGEYTVRASRTLYSQMMPGPSTDMLPRETVLAAGPLKLRLMATASGFSGMTAVTHPPEQSKFFYISNENHTLWTADGNYLSSTSAVSSFRVGQDGSVFPTLNPPGFVHQGTGSVAATPSGRFLYVGNEETVSQFRIGADGALFPLSPPTVPAQKFAGRLLMDPKGRFLYALSSWGNTLYSVGRDGRLRVTAMMPPEKWRKDSKHNVMPADFGVLNSTGTFLYACNGRTGGYRLGANGQVADAFETNPACAQRFTAPATRGGNDTVVALTPSGRFAFVLTSTWLRPAGSPAERYEDLIVPMRVRQNGDLARLPGSQTPRAPDGKAYGCTSLVVDPTSHFLLALNSQLGFIAPYRIGPEGSLTARRIIPTMGGPTGVLFVPGSPRVYILNCYPPSLLAFHLDGRTGLTPAAVGMPTYEIPMAPNLAAANAPTPPKPGLVKGGLRMSIRFGGDVQPAIKPLVLTVILKNVTDHPIPLGTAGADMASFRLSLVGPYRQAPGWLLPSGKPAAKAAPLLAAGHDLLDAPSTDGRALVLPPGKERQYQFVLSRLADLTVAGNYTIQISRILPSGTMVASPIVRVLLNGPVDGTIRGVNESELDVL